MEFPDAESDVHLLVGPNAAGKTNILEAVAVLALTKSCLGAEEEDLARWGSEYYRVRGVARADDASGRTLEVAFQTAPRRRKVCLQGDVHVSVGRMVGGLPVVLFLPQDLDLFSGPPQRRRQFFDQLLSQVSPEYLSMLTAYARILRQRNVLLRDIARGHAAADALAVWDQQLAEAGAGVTLRRLELVEVLQCSLADELSALGESWSDARIVYERKGQERTPEAMVTELRELLSLHRERDIALQATTVGPHREDWHLDAVGRDIATFASRGQQRAAVLALVFLQVSYMELKRGERPVILCDDVFSELDDEHQSALLSCFDGHQVFVTATHVPSRLHSAHVWCVGAGTASRQRDGVCQVS